MDPKAFWKRGKLIGGWLEDRGSAQIARIQGNKAGLEGISALVAKLAKGEIGARALVDTEAGLDDGNVSVMFEFVEKPEAPPVSGMRATQVEVPKQGAALVWADLAGADRDRIQKLLIAEASFTLPQAREAVSGSSLVLRMDLGMAVHMRILLLKQGLKVDLFELKR